MSWIMPGVEIFHASSNNIFLLSVSKSASVMVSLPLHYGESFYFSSSRNEYCLLNLKGETSGNETVYSGNTVILFNKSNQKTEGRYIIRSTDGKIIKAGVYPDSWKQVTFGNTKASIALLENPEDRAEEATTTQVAIYSALSGGYLTVCESCNNLPGFSVDVHAAAPSTAEGSIWSMITQSNGQVAFVNTLTGTYLSVCDGCNNLPAYSVDVHEATIGNSSLWELSSVTSGTTFTSVQSGTLLRVCYGCIKEPNGYSVDVGTSTLAPSSTWQIKVLTPPPGPTPGPSPPPTPTPTPLGPVPSKPSWILWTGVGLWLTGVILWLAVPQKVLALRIIGALISLVGIGLIFYSAFGK